MIMARLRPEAADTGRTWSRELAGERGLRQAVRYRYRITLTATSPPSARQPVCSC
jgi:hypothetical protein